MRKCPSKNVPYVQTILDTNTKGVLKGDILGHIFSQILKFFISQNFLPQIFRTSQSTYSQTLKIFP